MHRTRPPSKNIKNHISTQTQRNEHVLTSKKNMYRRHLDLTYHENVHTHNQT